MDLQEYNFVIKYRPGKANTKADLLSRRAGHDRGEQDNQGVILLKEELFVRLHDDDQALEDLITKAKKINKRQWEDVVRKGTSNREKGWKESEGLALWKERIYIPTDQTL